MTTIVSIGNNNTHVDTQDVKRSETLRVTRLRNSEIEIVRSLLDNASKKPVNMKHVEELFEHLCDNKYLMYVSRKFRITAFDKLAQFNQKAGFQSDKYWSRLQPFFSKRIPKTISEYKTMSFQMSQLGFQV